MTIVTLVSGALAWERRDEFEEALCGFMHSWLDGMPEAMCDK
jgi:hypothetical protein